MQEYLKRALVCHNKVEIIQKKLEEATQVIKLVELILNGRHIKNLTVLTFDFIHRTTMN